MSAPQFTPGPWFPNTPSNRRVFMPNDTVEIKAAGGLVACLYAENWPHGQDERNARLIAAAPELYEALAEFVAGADAGHVSVEADNAARAALAKARGEA